MSTSRFRSWTHIKQMNILCFFQTKIAMLFASLVQGKALLVFRSIVCMFLYFWCDLHRDIATYMTNIAPKLQAPRYGSLT